MRTFTTVLLLVAFVMSMAVDVHAFDLAAFSEHAPGNSWLAEISDRIVRERTPRTAEVCGSPLACGKVIAATLWQCESTLPRSTFAVRATLRLYGTIYYFDGPYRSRKPALDRSVVDGESAISHEYTRHIIPAAAAAAGMLDALEAERFPTRSRCEDAARKASGAVTNTFRKELAETQRLELAGRHGG